MRSHWEPRVHLCHSSYIDQSAHSSWRGEEPPNTLVNLLPDSVRSGLRSRQSNRRWRTRFSRGEPVKMQTCQPTQGVFCWATTAPKGRDCTLSPQTRTVPKSQNPPVEFVLPSKTSRKRVNLAPLIPRMTLMNTWTWGKMSWSMT